MRLMIREGTSSCALSRVSLDEQPSRPAHRKTLSRYQETYQEMLTESSHLHASQSACKPLFFKLPPEIRVNIYRYILPPSSAKFKVYTDCEKSYMDRKWDTKYQYHPRKADRQHSLAILRINKTIYFEALSVLYSENTFHFIGCNFLPVIDFIRRLSPDAKGLIRQLKITMLPEARHLRTDHLELFCKLVHEWLPGLNVLASDGWTWI